MDEERKLTDAEKRRLGIPEVTAEQEHAFVDHVKRTLPDRKPHTKADLTPEHFAAREESIRQYQRLNGRDPTALRMHPELEKIWGLAYRDKSKPDKEA